MPAAAHAQASDFATGPVITDFGRTAPVETDFKIPKRAKFKVLYDTKDATKPGEVNKSLTTAARFLNMHAKAGVPEKNMKLAVVFHGKGSFDLTRAEYYGSKYDEAENANAAIIKALLDKDVRIILCGQTAAFYGIKNEDLLPGVEMALSAMTAHAVLQQEGYTLNGF
jgi:intracellular sulfur oxidation DsrE/DsrF family protein